jgi:hypothetical protein
MVSLITAIFNQPSGTPMSKPLSPRLLSRVDLSLKKRLNVDAHSHLVRIAAHAHSEQDFIQSASRLLLNPREREAWVAVWMARLAAKLASGNAQHVQDDAVDTTGAGELDTSYSNRGADLDSTIEHSLGAR